MLRKIKRNIARHVTNIPGWRTDRKIVVFESDDWGMIRMASKKAFNWFLKEGYQVDQCPYNSNDALESNDDLVLLLETLNSVRDKNGNPAIFTLNNIVGNPDFEKIKQSEFQQYFYEPFTKTLTRYPNRDNVVKLYRQGISQKLVKPQFHGREHLNVNRWMEGLNSKNKQLHDAFDQNMFTVHKSGNINGRRDYLDAFGMGYDKDWVNIDEVLKSGLDLFEQLWGYRSLSFIAPCYVWPVEIEGVLAKNGVKFIQGTNTQRIPRYGNKINKKRHFLGQQNKLGQRYLVRNVHFEPTENRKRDVLGEALEQIELAFKYSKPAIISSHRVNYIGSIRVKNRDDNLILLKKLLQKIVNKYPDVEFMSSDQIGQLITINS